MSKFFISCDEATSICDKNQYGEATLMEKIKLNIHFLRCKICRLYTKQNILMSKILGNYAKETCAEKKCLSAEEKKELDIKVKQKINS